MKGYGDQGIASAPSRLPYLRLCTVRPRKSTRNYKFLPLTSGQTNLIDQRRKLQIQRSLEGPTLSIVTASQSLKDIPSLIFFCLYAHKRPSQNEPTAYGIALTYCTPFEYHCSGPPTSHIGRAMPIQNLGKQRYPANSASENSLPQTKLSLCLRDNM